VDNLVSNQRMVNETRINQDLRAAADLVARDLRRAGYWRNAPAGVFSAGAPTVIANPYGAVNLASNVIDYSFSRDTDTAISDTEAAGYRLNSGVLQMLRSTSATANWQPLTDPNTVTITSFTITPNPRTIELYTYCQCRITLSCAVSLFQVGGANYATRPRLEVRNYDLVITGQSPTDANVQRTIRESIRVRNDLLAGECPAA